MTYDPIQPITTLEIASLSKDWSALTVLPVHIEVWTTSQMTEVLDLSRPWADEVTYDDVLTVHTTFSDDSTEALLSSWPTDEHASSGRGLRLPGLLAHAANLWRMSVGTDNNELIWSDWAVLPRLSPTERDPRSGIFRGKLPKSIPVPPVDLPPYLGGSSGLERSAAIKPHISYVGQSPTFNLGVEVEAASAADKKIAGTPVLAQFAGLVAPEAEAEADQSTKITATEATTTATV